MKDPEIKNGKCDTCRENKPIIVTGHSEDGEGNREYHGTCFACLLKSYQDSIQEITKEELEEWKKEKKTRSSRYLQQIALIKESLENWAKLKTKHPEFQSEIEKMEATIKKHTAKIFPDEDLKELGVSKPTNWTPWIVGGIIVGVIIIGAITYWWLSKNKKETKK